MERVDLKTKLNQDYNANEDADQRMLLVFFIIPNAIAFISIRFNYFIFFFKKIR